MKKALKGFYLLVSSLFITVLHLPFAFGKTSPAYKLAPGPVLSAKSSTTDSLHLITSIRSVYDSLHLDISGLSRQAFEYAQKGWEKLIEQGKIINESVMAIVDFSQPSSHRRLYILDMKNYKVLFNTLVAHGKNSGKEWASSFSNKPSSYKSSPGFYITGDTYMGSNGFSLRLNGIEKGINDKAFDRAIVMHGADYVSDSYIEAQGYIGRSQGCPAVPAEEVYPIINTIKNGTCLFVYVPDKRYASRSPLLKG
ncbi:MAG: murein L,D-transpeptidase catalytic domain family protein [Bacteroidota bacterium]